MFSIWSCVKQSYRCSRRQNNGDISLFDLLLCRVRILPRVNIPHSAFVLWLRQISSEFFFFFIQCSFAQLWIWRALMLMSEYLPANVSCHVKLVTCLYWNEWRIFVDVMLFTLVTGRVQCVVLCMVNRVKFGVNRRLLLVLIVTYGILKCRKLCKVKLSYIIKRLIDMFCGAIPLIFF